MRNKCPLINDKCGVLTHRGLTKGGECFSAYSRYSSDISHTGGERLLNIAGLVRLPSKDKTRKILTFQHQNYNSERKCFHDK